MIRRQFLSIIASLIMVLGGVGMSGAATVDGAALKNASHLPWGECDFHAPCAGPWLW